MKVFVLVLPFVDMADNQVEVDENAMLVVFYALAAATLIYALLLFLLDTFAYSPGSQPSDLPLDLLTIVFAVVGLISVIVVNVKIIPMVNEVEKLQESFGIMLIGVILYEAIAIYGLFIGILQLFVLGEHVDWLTSGLFILISFLLVVQYIQTTVKGKIAESKDPMKDYIIR